MPKPGLRALVLLGLVACDGDEPPLPLQPTSPQPLIQPQTGSHDEDPSLIRARDGSLWLAYLSDQDGNDELYVKRSVDAIVWSAPIRVTSDPNPDWYPHLGQTRDGRLRLTWMRANAASPSRRWVMTTTSADGLAWNPASEVTVTDGSSDDWAPTFVEAANGDLLVYYTRAGDLHLSRQPAGTTTWLSPALLSTVSDPASYDVFPAVIERAPGSLDMVWVRYATSAGANYWDPSTNLLRATSADGVVWSGVTPIMSDGFVDSVPNLYPSADGTDAYVVWTSTGPSAPATPKILELPLSQAGAYPAAAIDCTATRGINGWSVAAAPTGTAGIFMGVWVNGDAGSNRLSWRLYSR